MSGGINPNVNGQVSVPNEKLSEKSKVNNNQLLENNNENIKQAENNVCNFEISDEKNVGEYKKGSAPVTTFDFSENISKNSETSPLYSKDNLSKDDLKVLDIISKVKDDTWNAAIKAFDDMLKHSEKVRKECNEYIKKVIIPKEEIIKKEVQKEEVQKQILQGT
ncbi:MAG: hypothetical protein U0457_11375 [Candidatus Sericytochromatia bacterium]